MPEKTTVHFGYRPIRPELWFTFEPPKPLTLSERVLGTLSEWWWGFLTMIAPTLPILGAFAGVALVNALWP